MSISITSALIGDQVLEQLATSLPERASRGVAGVARELRDLAAAAAPRATGSMAASIYVATHDGSDYAERTADALARNPKAVMLEEVTPDGPSEAIVGVAANHGIFLEYGTVRHAASPFLTPAAEAARANLPEHMTLALDIHAIDQ